MLSRPDGSASSHTSLPVILLQVITTYVSVSPMRTEASTCREGGACEGNLRGEDLLRRGRRCLCHTHTHTDLSQTTVGGREAGKPKHKHVFEQEGEQLVSLPVLELLLIKQV